MVPNPHVSRQEVFSGRDSELLLVLQDLSRLLDINSAANVGLVRAKIKELVDCGKIEAPTLSLSSASFSSELRVLARQEGLDARTSSLHPLPPSQIKLLLGGEPKSVNTPVDICSLPVPELSKIISDAIRRYSGFAFPRQVPKREGPQAGH